MSYYPDNDYRNYLEHSTGEWPQHKYLDKIMQNGKVRYIYDKVSGAAKNIRNKSRQFYRKTGIGLAPIRRAAGGAASAIRSAASRIGGAASGVARGARLRAGYAGTVASAQLRNARKHPGQTARGAVDAVRNAASRGYFGARSAAKKAGYKVKDTVGSAGRKAGSKLGGAARNIRNKSRKFYRETGIGLAPIRKAISKIRIRRKK